MSQSGPIVVVSSETYAPLHKALSAAKIFPAVDSTWREAAGAIARVKPCAVIVSGPYEPAAFAGHARCVETLSPYAPLLALDPGSAPLPRTAQPLTEIGARGAHRQAARLQAALTLRPHPALV